MKCCSSSSGDEPCCKVEAVVSVDERGQMVLPKDLREKVNIKAGDKLALVSWGQEQDVKFLALIRVEDLSKMVKQMLGPVFNVTLK
jgi:antitoxin PrlF